MADSSVKSPKHDKILEAAAREFAQKGYEKASTARICQNAGVSKGLLFHHFGTKKGLYLELYEDIMADFIGELERLTFEDCETYFDTIVKTSKMKLNYFARCPNAYDIVIEAQYNPPGEIKSEIKAIFDKYVNMDKYYSEMVFGRHKLRAGVDPRKAWEIVQAVVSLVERRIITEVALSDNPGKPRLEKIIGLSDELFEYFDIIFSGIAENGAGISEAPEGGLTRENLNDGKGRYKAV